MLISGAWHTAWHILTEIITLGTILKIFQEGLFNLTVTTTFNEIFLKISLCYENIYLYIPDDNYAPHVNGLSDSHRVRALVYKIHCRVMLKIDLRWHCTFWMPVYKCTCVVLSGEGLNTWRVHSSTEDVQSQQQHPMKSISGLESSNRYRCLYLIRMKISRIAYIEISSAKVFLLKFSSAWRGIFFKRLCNKELMKKMSVYVKMVI